MSTSGYSIEYLCMVETWTIAILLQVAKEALALQFFVPLSSPVLLWLGVDVEVFEPDELIIKYMSIQIKSFVLFNKYLSFCL